MAGNARHYIKDKRNLGLDRWFASANPHARQMLAARLIEIDRQGVYRFNESDRRALVAAYVESVNRSGVSCYVNSCANRNLIRYVAVTARDLKAATAADLVSFETAHRAASTATSKADSSSAAQRVKRRATLGENRLASLFGNVRIFEVPLSSLRFRRPETAAGWAILLLPLPFGVLVGFLRRRYWASTSPTGLRITH